VPCLPASFCRAFVTDHYVRALPPEVRGHLVLLHMLRATGDLAEMPDRVLAGALGCNAETFGDVTRILEESRLAFRRAEGDWELKDARKRRYGHGESTARVRAWRQKKREEQLAGCNAGNAALHDSDVTHESFTLPDALPGTSQGALRSGGEGAESGEQGETRLAMQGGRDREGGSGTPLVTQTPGVTEASQDGHVYVYVERNRKKNVYVNETAEEGKDLRSPVTPFPGNEGLEHQMCFGSPKAPLPAPRVIPEKAKRQAEFNELIRELPAEALNQKKDAGEWNQETKNLQKVYLKRGFDFVLWNIRYVKGQPGVNNFWAYLFGDAIKHNRGELEKERSQACGSYEDCEASPVDFEGNGGGGEVLQEENRPAGERDREATLRKGKAELGKLSADHVEVLRRCAIARFPESFQAACRAGKDLHFNAGRAIEEIMIDLLIEMRICREWPVRDPVAEWGPLIDSWLEPLRTVSSKR